MPIALIGKTSSGKTFIRNKLVEYGYEPVITYTTRPMRPGEENGKDYHFISSDEFSDLERSGFFAETTSYKVAYGETWHYGTSKDSLSNNKSVIIVNPEGLKSLKDYGLISFYLKCNEEVIRQRLIDRGDDKAEYERRILADTKDFSMVEYMVDYVIRNDRGVSAANIAKAIAILYEGNNIIIPPYCFD